MAASSCDDHDDQLWLPGSCCCGILSQVNLSDLDHPRLAYHGWQKMTILTLKTTWEKMWFILISIHQYSSIVPNGDSQGFDFLGVTRDSLRALRVTRPSVAPPGMSHPRTPHMPHFEWETARCFEENGWTYGGFPLLSCLVKRLTWYFSFKHHFVERAVG